MKHYRKWLVFGLALLSGISLAACSNGAQGTNKHVHLSESYTAPNKASKAGDNGTLRVAEVDNSPFAGISSPTLQTMEEDINMYQPGGEDKLFNTNKRFQVTNGGLGNLKFNRKNNTATVTLRKNARWSNGAKVTAKDVEYPYEIMGNKFTKSQHYSDAMNDLKGMSAYHSGKAKTISGVTYPDGQKGRKAVLHFKKLVPAMKFSTNDYMWNGVEPYEYLKNIPIKKLQSSPQVRKHPLFVGPYKLKKEVQGESTDWVPNKYYYGPKPHIKHVHLQVVSPSNLTAAMKAKKYDFAFDTPAAQYPRVKSLKDYSEVGMPDRGYEYFGFNVGHLNDNGNNVMDKDSKVANPNLRKAMMYALDLNMVFKKFGYGLEYRANSLISPGYKGYHASYSSDPGFSYNMSKAKKLLKDAGYKKRNGSKYVSQPNGKKLVLHFGCPEGSEANNAQYDYYLQQWHKLGLDVKYTNGRPMPLTQLASITLKPKQHQADVYSIDWRLDGDPSPTNEYGPHAVYDMGHFVSAKNTKLLKEMNSKKAFKKSYRRKVFKEWQKYMNKEAAYAPEYYFVDWTPVNHRVKGYSMSPAANEMWAKMSLTSASPK